MNMDVEPTVEPSRPETSAEDDAEIAFNRSDINDTVIENKENQRPAECKSNSCEGSDSGVEVIDCVATVPSCDSSIISCYSNYDEAYNLLVRRNSTLLDDYKLRNVDGTSENGSESSSVASTKATKRSLGLGVKKKVVLENKRPSIDRSRTKPPLTPKQPPTNRTKSIERTTNPTTPKTRSKPVPDNLAVAKKTSKTPITTPTDDGRWPSTKIQPVMARSLRGSLLDSKSSLSKNHEAKTTLEKYATLPRRRKERSSDDDRKSRENSTVRTSLLVKKQTPLKPQKKPAKTKIYHEIGAQTALDLSDIEKALAGVRFNPADPQKAETATKETQVDKPNEELLKLQEKYDGLAGKYERLKEDLARLADAEQKLQEERSEKEGLKEELKKNNERVVAMLGCDGSGTAEESSDSLMVLETRFQNVSQVILKQEEEISKLNAYCRALQRDFEKSLANQKVLVEHQRELEAEGVELQEFMQMEKSTLSEALKESEAETRRTRGLLAQKEKELENKQEECRLATRMNEHRRQENISLQARFVALEAKCRELLVHQGSAVSGAAVALSALISRLDGLVDELVNSYNISDQELDDVIFHNEAYSNSSSSPDVTPDKTRKLIIDKSPSPKRGSSFVSAVINAIRNATTQSPFITNRENSKDNVTDNSDSTELLDSETEPCLMMEHVLEDVVVPDGHTHNMISSCHGMLRRLSHSESLNSLPVPARKSEQSSRSENLSSLSELCSSVSLVDQVIDVDNLVTRLLKVIRIIQMDNEDYINELQDERDSFCGQVNTQRETNKIVVKQLKDWEVLGAKLKAEVKELLQQLGRKNGEIEDTKVELNLQRKEVEKLNQDVCDLSTALSKAELEGKVREEEVAESVRKWEESGNVPSNDVLGRLIITHSEVPALKNKLQEKDKQINELIQENIANRQILSDSLKEAVNEAKKQYDAIDSALETLHSIQGVVQQCPQLMKLQRELEETSFQSASAMPLVPPPDCNANAALLKAMAGMEIAATPIDTTA